ncbi:hypothetical protein LTR06_011071 [Exophiala xenobiotica]|nr:hypothetical protein LTR06_011071 [Exophiala xenobiotica]
MPQQNKFVTKVHFKGNTDSFIIFVESAQDVERWKKDRSIPLIQVVNSLKIMVTHKQGAQGHLDGASKASLENEFGTSDETKVITTILEQGDVQNTHRNGVLLMKRWAQKWLTTEAPTHSEHAGSWESIREE